MFNSRVYASWKRQVEQHVPDKCRTRVRNLLLLVVGMYAAQSVTLSKIARTLPVRAHRLSLTRRLRRFLDNEAVDVWAWYEPWARQLIANASRMGRLHLVLDTTKVGSNRQKLSVAVAYRRRTLPLMWDWVEHHKAHSSAMQQVALLARLRRWLPADVAVSVVGDSEFGSGEVVNALSQWGWDYALRQRKQTTVRQAHTTFWRRFDALPIRPGRSRWWGHVTFTQRHLIPAHVVVIWQHHQARPLYLVTNQSTAAAAYRLYKRRMWIEQMFGDMKRNGFCLEHSRLRSAARLSRLTLVVCLLYLWLVALGEDLTLWRRTREIDRASRCDLSIFRLGWDFLQRALALDDPLPEHFVPSLALSVR